MYIGGCFRFVGRVVIRVAQISAIPVTDLSVGGSAWAADTLVAGHPAQLVFNDEFDVFHGTPSGRLAGRPVWQTRYFHGARTLPTNHEVQVFSDNTTGINPFRVESGVLNITAAPAAGLPAGASYSSGLITTYESFRAFYGYFEVRAKLAGGPGMWPAFWMLPADGSWPPEIDIFEALGSLPNAIFTTVHSSSTGMHIQQQARLPVPDAVSAFHTYGLSWRPDKIEWYVDGERVFERPTPLDLHQPLYLLAGLAVGGEGSWPGKAASETATMSIDFIRAYQFQDLPSR